MRLSPKIDFVAHENFREPEPEIFFSLTNSGEPEPEIFGAHENFIEISSFIQKFFGTFIAMD